MGRGRLVAPLVGGEQRVTHGIRLSLRARVNLDERGALPHLVADLCPQQQPHCRVYRVALAPTPRAAPWSSW